MELKTDKQWSDGVLECWSDENQNPNTPLLHCSTLNMRWLVTVILLMSACCLRLLGATPVESRAFKAAKDVFQAKLYPVAEKQLAEFVAKYPDSEDRAEAILYQAGSRFFQTNYAGAVELLQSQLPQAGQFADQYRYWLGENFYHLGKYEEAANQYGEVVKSFPLSTLYLAACYDQALCYSRLGNLQRAIELLRDPEGAFRKASQLKPGDIYSVQGVLLLSEALLAQKKFSDSEKFLGELDQRILTPESAWRQQYLLCRIQLAGGRMEQALATSSNLLQVSSLTTSPRFTGDAIGIQGEILEKMKRLPEAIEAYEKSLADGLPQEIRRQALFKAIQLTLTQKKTDEAISKLERFIGQHTNDLALDVAFFTLGELRLKQFYIATENKNANETADQTIVALTTNILLRAAFTNFSNVITNFPRSEFLGKSYLNRGWCAWIAENLEMARKDFTEAATRLPRSEDQAIARFKLADVQFKLKNYSEAVANYNMVIRDYGDFTAIKSTLFDQALYQVVRASLAQGNYDTAKEAMARILEWYPDTGYAERSVLLIGQDLNRKGSPAEARALFLDFIKKAPDSTLLPEVKLAIVRTYVQERKWRQAIQTLDEWSADFENHPMLPHAEFSRALVTCYSGMQTNALALFTNFVVRFPSHSLTPIAQNWVADYYFNCGELILAEQNYQLVGKKNPPRDLACQALMGAGRSAFHRRAFNQALKYFTELINDTNTPSPFLAEAYYALGDTVWNQFLEDTNNVANFQDAITAYNKVIKEFPTNALVPLAWGRIGDCQYQWGYLKDSSAYDAATNAYTQVLESPLTDISARSLAEVGLGKVFEMRDGLDAALEHYAKVLYGNIDEEFDVVCVKEAGLAAAKICEGRQQWEQAINLYLRLQEMLPALKPTLEKKIAIAKTRLEAVKN